MSSSVPDEGAPCSFDKWRDLSAAIAGLAPRRPVRRSRQLLPAEPRAREKERRVHTSVRDFKRESTLSASRQRHRVYGRQYRRDVTIEPRSSYPPAPPRFSLLLLLSLHEIFPQSNLTHAGLTHPLGFPLSTHVTHTHAHAGTYIDRTASQCPNIPQSKMARRLFTRLLRPASIMQRTLGPSDRIATIFTISYDSTIIRPTHRGVIVHCRDPRLIAGCTS